MLPLNADWIVHKPYLRNGAYTVRFRHRGSGEVRYIATGKTTRTEALEFAKEWAEKHLAGRRDDIRFSDAARLFLDSKDVRPSTLRGLELDFLFYSRMLENPTVRSVDARALDEFFRALKTAGRTPRTLQRHLVSLREFFRWAIRRRYADEDPTEGFKFKAGATKKIRRALTLDEQRRLLEAGRKEPDVRLAVYLALRTGLRYRNVLGMRWEWLDLDRGTIRVPAEEYETGHVFEVALARDVV